MDNMLYIIAGLVLILIVAVLVMRKNKAQKPSDQPSIKTDRTESLSTQAASKDIPAKASSNNEKKFDHIEIAQRFMDQQRYDKAIETLNRGLIERPHDSPLSLKLLAVYATIDQSDNFNKVYDSIKAHNDVKSIAQADELKALLTEEPNQIAQQSLPADNSQDAGFEGIDFDMSADKVENNALTFDTTITQPVENENDLLNATDETLTISNDFDSFNNFDNFDNIDQAFDLSQNNLEDNTSVTPATTLDIANEETLVSSTTVTSTDNNDFDFELSEQSDLSTESPITAIANDNLNEITLDEEDFVLDLADLEIDAGADNVSVDDQVATDAIQKNEDGLTLSLDGIEGIEGIEGIDSIDASNATENQTAIEQPIVLEDSFDDFNIAGDLGESHSFEDNKTEVSSMSPTTVMFDDNTLIDDDFDFDTLSDSPTATMPVEIESDHDVSGIDYSGTGITAETTIETAEDFSSRFAADFDFVKTLDSNQVTLDLAGQYVQLGEYDSAKRLLNEVLTQGNSEQQQQAQLLLERTA